MRYAKNICVLKEERYFADMDNERPFDEDVVGLTKTDEITGFTGKRKTIKDLDYVYLYMDTGDNDFVFSEGIVIKNPYPSKPYKWCCKLLRPIEYMSDYIKSFGRTDVPCRPILSRSAK